MSAMAQSKKEQITILNIRIDSLKKEYVKDKAILNNNVVKIEKENNMLSEQLGKVKDQLKKKSNTITDKSNTIKSLNAKNMELMQDLKDMRTKQKDLFTEQKVLKLNLDSVKRLNSIMSEGVMIPENAIPFHGILKSESLYDGTWSYELNFDKGHLMGVSTLYVKSGFEDEYEINCSCPEYESIPEGARVFGFAVQSRCAFEDVSDGSVRTKECYRPVILRKY